jgi:hypothetical protein
MLLDRDVYAEVGGSAWMGTVVTSASRGRGWGCWRRGSTYSSGRQHERAAPRQRLDGDAVWCSERRLGWWSGALLSWRVARETGWRRPAEEILYNFRKIFSKRPINPTAAHEDPRKQTLSSTSGHARAPAATCAPRAMADGPCARPVSADLPQPPTAAAAATRCGPPRAPRGRSRGSVARAAAGVPRPRVGASGSQPHMR